MRAGDLFKIAGYVNLPYNRHGYRIQATGEFRQPRMGEWYISGAIPEGYQALNDLPSKYHIGQLVRVRERIVTEVIEVIEVVETKGR